jgi:6-phosphogluconolactonase
MVKVFADSQTVLTALADFIVAEAREAVAGRGRFNFVLSGGSSPRQLFELLASEPYRQAIAWAKVFFFFGDERYVPRDHTNSNFRMAKLALLDPLQILPDAVFAVNTSLSPAAAAQDYERRIRDHLDHPDCPFDLILLGLGDNSHTASLFPYTSVLHEQQALVKEVFVEEVDSYRITFTAPLINAARTVAFLVYGPGKAIAVRHILEGSPNVEEFPAQLIHPRNGKLFWFLDESAASLISPRH